MDTNILKRNILVYQSGVYLCVVRHAICDTTISKMS